MTKPVQWAKILGLKGVKIYKDKNRFGFTLSIKTSCSRKQLNVMVQKLRVEGYNITHSAGMVHERYGYGLFYIETDKLSVARAKLTDADFALVKADILAGNS